MNKKGCKSRRFSFLRNHPLTVTVDWQSIRVQEIAQHETGKVPRTVEVEISEDLCDAARPGDVVAVTGVVKHINVGCVVSCYNSVSLLTFVCIELFYYDQLHSLVSKSCSYLMFYPNQC